MSAANVTGSTVVTNGSNVGNGSSILVQPATATGNNPAHLIPTNSSVCNQQQQQHSQQQSTATTITVANANIVSAHATGNSGGVAGSNNGGTNSNCATNNTAIQLVGTIQQGGRNIQVIGTKQLTGNRQLITTHRQIGASTLKLAAATTITSKFKYKLNHHFSKKKRMEILYKYKINFRWCQYNIAKRQFSYWYTDRHVCAKITFKDN